MVVDDVRLFSLDFAASFNRSSSVFILIETWAEEPQKRTKELLADFYKEVLVSQSRVILVNLKELV